MKRRETLKVLSALPLLAAMPSVAMAPGKKEGKAGNMLDPKDTLASAMQYVPDASKASAVRTDKKAFCHNCAKYNVCMDGDSSCKPLSAAELKKAKAAPCQIFKGKLVSKDGWCLSWQAKG